METILDIATTAIVIWRFSGSSGMKFSDQKELKWVEVDLNEIKFKLDFQDFQIRFACYAVGTSPVNSLLTISWIYAD